MDKDKIYQSPETIPDAAVSHNGEAPPDPSNTSNIGQPIEQGVISKKEGISEQSARWEDKQERGVPGEGDNSMEKRVENYLKNPSPEDMNDDEGEEGLTNDLADEK